MTFIGCLDAAAGTGKTFTLNTVIERQILAGKNIISFAFSGLAGEFIIGGSTFHSHLCDPLDPS